MHLVCPSENMSKALQLLFGLLKVRTDLMFIHFSQYTVYASQNQETRITFTKCIK